MAQLPYTPTSNRFDLDTQVLCLDFANTLDWHASEHPIEGLLRYSDLVDFGMEAGLLTPDEAGQLKEKAAGQPGEADQWLAEAITLREAIYRIFMAVAWRQAIAQPDLDILTRFWRQAAQSRRMASQGQEIGWEWEYRPDDLGRMLWPVVRSAVDLLESKQLDRVGQCEDDRGCGWLFLDTSRNRSRRWCSMESCGNRAKANRHYTRAKKSAPGES
jgi:predicted RNA-binding Zn ribbon-like protein